jgi:mercuric ion transport protein
MVRRITTKAERFSDWAGPLGAAFAALCCLGVPFIVAAIAAVGLSFLRSDPILWPLMIVSILTALWGMWMGWRNHRNAGPFILTVFAGTALVAGVIFVHGFPARELIYGGSAAIVGASIWNATLRTRCERRA